MLNVILTDDVFFENCQQEQGNGDKWSFFTAQQCQVLSALLKQNSANNVTSQPSAQLNQVGSFTVDANHKDSPLLMQTTKILQLVTLFFQIFTLLLKALRS